MKKKSIDNETCPIARTVSCLGDRWSLLILRDALLGRTRFDEFRKSLKIAPTILTQRLTSLTEEGLLEKRMYSERPPREEYVLTKAGQDVFPLLMIFGAWSRKHRNQGKLTKFVNAETNKPIRPVVIDATTGEKIDPRMFRSIPAG